MNLHHISAIFSSRKPCKSSLPATLIFLSILLMSILCDSYHAPPLGDAEKRMTRGQPDTFERRGMKGMMEKLKKKKEKKKGKKKKDCGVRMVKIERIKFKKVPVEVHKKFHKKCDCGHGYHGDHDDGFHSYKVHKEDFGYSYDDYLDQYDGNSYYGDYGGGQNYDY
ncbi:hypothetical protein HDE_05359 [Halotydeus destructor]|nr:hypothetical protein HDE_05359 [Halotydeus destructor]